MTTVMSFGTTLGNFPGTWDDNLVDKIPEPWLNKGSRLLFGSGRTRLATGSVGADARLGIGGELSGHAGMAEDGLIEFGGSAGGAFGLGGGVSTSGGGVNPVAIGRLGMLKGMEGVNTGYDRASELSEQARERDRMMRCWLVLRLKISAKKADCWANSLVH